MPSAGKADEVIDSLNNQEAKRLWRWELRNLLSLPKPLQPKAKLLKKNLHEVASLGEGGSWREEACFQC